METNLHKDPNPLLEKQNSFDSAVPFAKIRTEHFIPALDEALAKARGRIQKIIESTDTPQFENVIVALETSSEELDQIVSIYSNLEGAHGNEAHRQLGQEIYPKLSAFSSDLTLNPKLFAKIKAVYDNKKQLKLSPEQDRLLEKTYLSFVRNGALLGKSEKDRVRQIDQELSVLSPQFSENLLKSTNAFEVVVEDSAELAGIPEAAVEIAQQTAELKGYRGRWLFNLQAPSVTPVLTFASHRPLREKIWKGYNARAYKDSFDNQELILKTVQLRHQRAQILGFKTHADYVLAERMAKDTGTVRNFLKKILQASRKTAERELNEVKEFALQMDGLKDFAPWDFGYYSEKLKESRYAFNEEDLRPYFQLEKVVEGVFEHARKLYGLTFKETSKVDVYAPDVKAYEVYEEATEKFVALFYTDFFPRETKRNGAWMTNYREQGLIFGKVQRPHVSIVCNFTKPTSKKPSLLSYDEVKTLFHEFGHALHGLLSECTYRSVGGTNVYWDFVELPSQIMENWVGEKEGLDLFARHFETGALIPQELVEKIKSADRFLAGWTSLRQIQYGLLDLAWHTTDPAAIVDVDVFEKEATAETRLLPVVPGTNSSCGFSHIFPGGYSAGYYSYKWAEVLDADAFEYFKEKGIFNPEVARQFKECILSRGGTEHPMSLYKKFRGREPDPEALLRRDGLLEKNS